MNSRGPVRRVYGVAYLHGLFDNQQPLHWFNRCVRRFRREHPDEELVAVDYEREDFDHDKPTPELMHRPGWQRILDRIQNSPETERIKYLFVRNLHWLGTFAECAVADLKIRGVEVITHDDDPTSQQMREFVGRWTAYQRFVLTRRLRQSRQRSNAATGRHEGKKRYGFYPGETQVIEQIKTMRAQGWGLDRIAKALNEDNVKPRSGKRWHGSVIQSILKKSDLNSQPHPS